MKAVVTSLFAALFVFASSMSLPAPSRADGDGDMKNCYSVRGEARYGALAYKHIVIVSNRCDVTLQCEVWTDVDPSPRQSVSVEPQGTAEVLVRAVSPARAFKAFGECKK
ncbi:MAG: hypothetical protein KJN97_05775 [Deltaproteobacteria bacterium]|nr:hypothetical protein [Deltaproteobacteria bacterium]